MRRGGPGPLAGGWVSARLPAPAWDWRICRSAGSPEREDTSKVKQSALENLREMPDLPPSSFSPPWKLAAHSGAEGCQGQK